MQKAHDPSMNDHYRNLPEVTSPIIAEILNMDQVVLDTLDDRVIVLNTAKADQSDLLDCIYNVNYNPATGVFTYFKKNGTQISYDTPIEKITTNWRVDDDPTSPYFGYIILTLEDGTYQYIDLRLFMTIYSFSPSDTINPVVTSGIVKMHLIDGSVTPEKLQPNYLADITVQAEHAAASATASAGSATLSESWAIGGTGTRQDEDTQNSKYYADLAEETVAELLAAFGIEVVGTRLVFGATFEDQYEIEVSGEMLVITERV